MLAAGQWCHHTFSLLINSSRPIIEGQYPYMALGLGVSNAKACALHVLWCTDHGCNGCSAFVMQRFIIIHIFYCIIVGSFIMTMPLICNLKTKWTLVWIVVCTSPDTRWQHWQCSRAADTHTHLHRHILWLLPWLCISAAACRQASFPNAGCISL